jgi:type I restriction enzyme S subunit
LINSTGVGTAGRVTLFDLDGDFLVDSHITIFRPNEKVISKLALYSLAHIGFDKIEKMANGSSGQIELSLETIKQITISVPSLSEQQRIVAEIERWEAKIAETQAAMNTAVERKKQILEKFL